LHPDLPDLASSSEARTGIEPSPLDGQGAAVNGAKIRLLPDGAASAASQLTGLAQACSALNCTRVRPMPFTDSITASFVSM